MPGPEDFCCCPFSAFSASMMYRPTYKKELGFFQSQIAFYQNNIDPKLKRKLNVKKICKFTPTCSEYARMAIKKRGAFGIIHAIARLMRCNPFSRGGYDPVK